MNILRCTECGTYGLKKQCECGATKTTPKPPKYSVEDKYKEYRQKARKREHGWT